MANGSIKPKFIKKGEIESNMVSLTISVLFALFVVMGYIVKTCFEEYGWLTGIAVLATFILILVI